MQFPLVTLALIAIARSVTGLESNGKDTIKVRRYGSIRPNFMDKECKQPGVVCLFEVTRPSRAFVNSTYISYQESVHGDQKVLAFKGSKQMGKTLVAIHPGTKLKMECNEDDFITFDYQEDGTLKSTESGGSAKAAWTKDTFSATGSIKVDRKSHKTIRFQCK